MKEYTIPLIIRGRIIEDKLVSYPARRGGVTFKTPDVNAYFNQIVLNNPSDIRDLYSISLDEIVDYLDGIANRLDFNTNPHLQLAHEISAQTSGSNEEMLRRCYSGMASTLRKESVSEIIDQCIGREFLEGWDRRDLRDRKVSIRAFGGRFVHMIAGNSPVVMLRPLMAGAVLRCDNIVKLPSNDLYTAVAIARTMIDMAPDHPITKHMTIAYWKGGDQAFEKRLFGGGKVDKIMAWGGESSMKSIRSYLGPGLDLVSMDPKVSASIIGGEALESEKMMETAAKRLARDFGYLNQDGCVNARVAYVISGTSPENIEKVNAFGKKVVAALRDLPPALSTPHPDFDPVLKDEIDGIRYAPGFRVFGCKGNEGGVIVSQSSEQVDFRDRLSGRVINLIPVDTPEEATAYMTVHTQTVGVFPPSLKEKVRDDCLLHGAQRITELGGATMIGHAYPHDGMEIMRRMARWGTMESFDEEAMESGIGILMATD